MTRRSWIAEHALELGREARLRILVERGGVAVVDRLLDPESDLNTTMAKEARVEVRRRARELGFPSSTRAYEEGCPECGGDFVGDYVDLAWGNVFG